MQKPCEITSKSNPRIKDYLKLKKRSHRHERRMYLGEGIQLLREALASDIPIEAVFLTMEGERRAGKLGELIPSRCGNVFRVSAEVMSLLTGTVTPQGIVAVLPFTHFEEDALPLGHNGPLAFLDKVRDPGNLGTMIRVADAAGASSVMISKASADLYNQKTVRATAGSLLHLPIWIEVESRKALSELRENGWRIVAADPRAKLNLWEHHWVEKTVVVLGNEAWGIPPEDEALVDDRVSIPIFGKAESLNVAAAASLMLYEIKRMVGGGA